MLSNVSFDGLDQFSNTAKATAADLLLGQVSKEALDHVEPGSTGRSEMNMEPFVVFQPGLHVGMFVG